MTRLRIRSLKPEMWQDEKIGRVTRDARLLFVGLITLADDEGRFRAPAPLVLGHIYPWDTVSPRRLESWMRELEEVGLVVRYEVGGQRYGHLPGWAKHQVINRARPSMLPEPSVNGRGKTHARDRSAA